jgi:hypothetical protein
MILWRLRWIHMDSMTVSYLQATNAKQLKAIRRVMNPSVTGNIAVNVPPAVYELNAENRIGCEVTSQTGSSITNWK